MTFRRTIGLKRFILILVFSCHPTILRFLHREFFHTLRSFAYCIMSFFTPFFTLGNILPSDDPSLFASIFNGILESFFVLLQQIKLLRVYQMLQEDLRFVLDHPKIHFVASTSSLSCAIMGRPRDTDTPLS